MQPQFICHPDFQNQKPLPILGKGIKREKLPKEQSPFLCRHILFRKKVNIEDVNKAILKITADDYYKLYINGKFVAQGPAPCYPWSYYYNQLDVSDYLVVGENTFAVHTYYQGLVNLAWVSGERRQSFWCELAVDGVPILVSDTSWKCTDHTGYTPYGKAGYDTAFLECYDCNSSEEDFMNPAFDDSAWGNAAIYKHADYILQKQPTPQLEMYDVQPQTVEEIPGGLRLDFGQEMVGYLHLTGKGQKGDEVQLYFGEECNDDGSIRYAMRCNCVYAEKWILSGKVDTLRQYEYKAFRYVEIKYPDSVVLDTVAMTVRHYPFTQQPVYQIKNPTLQQILKLCANTVKYGTQECYVDCPTREKGQYLGDVSVSGRAHAVLTGDTSLIKKAIREFCASSIICPGIMSVSSGGQMHEIADYSLQLPALVTWVYHMDGDLEFVKETLPYMTGIYQHFSKFMNSFGLLEQVDDKWNLVDWPANLRDGYDFPMTDPIGPGMHNVLNAFWVGFLQAMDELYSLAGLPATGRTKTVKQAFIDVFYSEALGLFCDSPAKTHAAVHSNVLPLLFQIGTEDGALRERLIDFVAEKGLTCMGVYMAYFTLAALVQNGRRDLAEQLTLDPGCWQLMLRQGATTTFEAWGKEQKWNCSLFHPWAVAPLIVFAEGIRVY